jgi:hypothetical protein
MGVMAARPMPQLVPEPDAELGKIAAEKLGGPVVAPKPPHAMGHTRMGRAVAKPEPPKTRMGKPTTPKCNVDTDPLCGIDP